MIDPIAAMNAALSDLQSLAGAAAAPPSSQLLPNPVGGADVATGATPSFSQALHSALGRLDDTLAHANTQAKAFAAGDQSIPLSDVMVSLEQANLALQMAAGVRDKVVAAYSNVMNMQV
ncbi:MAG TPA: flagellar hook-basal body complex protein FliE [Stellaceae bacterium]|nr:flagellar hook-basal body complex protein FliE [Stellaceae bacterium]